MKMNISKFSLAECFSNDNGKSSGSGFAGVVICLVCSIGFIAGIADKMFISHTSDIMNSCIGFATLGAGLLGVRKFMQNKPAPNDIETSKVDEPAVDTQSDTTPADDAPEAEGSTKVDNPDV